MTTLHAHFILRNQQAFQRLLDTSSRSNAQTTPAPALSTSGGKSWTKPSPLSSGQGVLSCDINARDWLGRTVLHLAVSSLDPAALEYVRLLLAHPRIDVNLPDTESRWSPFHRALYAGNLAACILLLQRSDIDTSVKDYEGYTAFDVYNSTVEGTKPDEEWLAGDLFTWGANRNAALGHGDSDDRAHPDQISVHPAKEYSEPLKQTLSERFQRTRVTQAAMSKLHTVVVTSETKPGNLRLCGFGSGGRLGPGSHTQYTLVPLASLQHTVTAVALGQDHTLVITLAGDVLSWGLNRFSQLGYTVEAPTGAGAQFSATVEPVQTVPRRVVGPLKKEIVRGVAACRTASACWTDEELFTWGTNNGQLGYDKNAQPVQILPRKVTPISQPVIDIALTDNAMACLLDSKDVICFWNGRNFKINFPTQNFPSEIQAYRPPMALNNANIAKVVSCENTFAALSSNGEMFTFALNTPPTSTDGATQSKSSVTIKPHRVWALRKQFSAVKDVALGSEGTIILCTESGHVFIRSRNVKAGQAVGAKTFKFQRVPFIQRVVRVCANSTGAFGAIRADCPPTPISLVGNSVAQDLSLIQPYYTRARTDEGLSAGSESKDVLSPTTPEAEDDFDDTLIKQDTATVAQLCDILSRRGEQKGLLDNVEFTYGADLFIRVESGLEFPVHRVLIAARSPVLKRVMLGQPVKEGRLQIELSAPDGRVSFSGVHPLSILLLLSYLYTDELLAVWDRRIGLSVASQLEALKISPPQLHSELQLLANRLHLRQLECALEAHVKRVPSPSLSRDMQTLFDSAQDFTRDSIVATPTDPLAPNVLLELSDRHVLCHSTILRARSPFFASFFDDEDWTAKRWRPDRTVSVNLKHMKWREFSFVIRYIYCGTGKDMFDVLEFTRNVDDVLEFMFEVMAIANELLLDRLLLVCSTIVLEHISINNVCSLLSDATHFHATQLVSSVQGYMSRNMETLLESRMLDDLTPYLIKQLSAFVRSQQALKFPLTRSNKLVEKALGTHAAWLEQLDIPQPIVRSGVRGAFRQSPRLSPVASGKRCRRSSTGPLSPTISPKLEPRLAPPSEPASASLAAAGDDIFIMDDDVREVPPLNLAPVPATPVPTSGPSQPLATPSTFTPWKAKVGQVPPRTDLRSIMAEAENQKVSASPLVTPPGKKRVVGFDIPDATSSPSRMSQRVPAVPDSRGKASSSPWRIPMCASSSSTPNATQVSTPGLVDAPTAHNTPQSGISRVMKDTAVPTFSRGPSSNSIISVQCSPSPGKEKATGGPMLGPTFNPAKQVALTSVPRRSFDNAGAWAEARIQPMPTPEPSASPPSFIAIQQQQRDQGIVPAKSKKSLREIQEEEEARQAEEDFMRWWAAEEERVKLETQLSTAEHEKSGKKGKAARKKPPFKGSLSRSNPSALPHDKERAPEDNQKASQPKRSKGQSATASQSKH